MTKAKTQNEVKKLTDIPNVGPLTAESLNLIGIYEPLELKNKDAHELFKKIYRVSGIEHDPCTADVLMSAVSFMNGNKPRKWWEFTKERKGL